MGRSWSRVGFYHLFCSAVIALALTPQRASAAASLSVQMSAAPNPVAAGALLTYTIQVTNDGTDDALGVVIDSEAPPLTTFVAASDGGVLQPNGRQVLWNIGTLAGLGGTETVTLEVAVDFPLAPGTRIGGLVIVTATNAPAASAGTFTNVSGLGVSVSVATAPANCLGSPFRVYKILFANGSTTPATDLVLTADVPAGTTLTPAPGDRFKCSASPVGCLADSDCPLGETCNTAVVFWDIGDLAPAALGFRTFGVRISDTEPAGTIFASTATLSSTTGNPPQDGVDSAPTTTVADLPCLAVDKVNFGPSTVEPGGTLQYRIVASNLGRAPDTNVLASDPLPAGTEFGTADPSACPGGDGPVGTLGADDVVRWSLGNLAPDTQVTLCLELDVREDIASSTVVNAVSLTDDEGDLTTDTDSTDVRAVTALRLTKDAEPSPVAPGEQVTYTLTFRNVAEFDVTGVTITDDLAGVTPAGCVTFDAAATAACGGDVPATGLHCSTSQTACTVDSECPSGETCSLVKWSVGTVVPSAEASVCYVVTVGNCSGQLRNVATATDDRGEVATAAGKTLVTGPVALRIFKEAPGQRRVKAGDPIIYTLRVRNLTAGPLTNVTITDDLDAVTPPGALSFLSASRADCGGTGPDGVLAGNVVTWTFASLPPGEQTVCLRALANPSLSADDVITNIAQASDDGGNFTEDSLTTKVFVERLRVRIVDQDDPVQKGGVIRYLISVENLGTDTFTDLTILSRVPSGTSADCVSGSLSSDCPLEPEDVPSEFGAASLARDPLVRRGGRLLWSLPELTPEAPVKRMRMTVRVKSDTKRRSIRAAAKVKETAFRAKSKGRALTVVE